MGRRKNMQTCKCDMCKCKYHIIHSPQGFLGIIYKHQEPRVGSWQHWLGDFARQLKVQFTSNEGMSNDAPIHECECEINHYTGHYVPYSLRKTSHRFFITGARACEKGPTVYRPYPRRLESQTVCRSSADVITKAVLSPQLFKDPEGWSGLGLNLEPPAQQTGAYPIMISNQEVIPVWNSHVCDNHLTWPLLGNLRSVPIQVLANGTCLHFLFPSIKEMPFAGATLKTC